MANVVAIVEMNQHDGTRHDDDDAGSADAEERAEQDGDAAGELGEPHEIADDVGHFHEGGKVVGTGATEGAEEDGGAVVDEGKRAGKTHDQELEFQFAHG